MATNPLVGTSKLISWENRTLEGEVSHPLGEDALGYIAYAEDGHMFVAIMGQRREPFAAGDLSSGSGAEKARAAESFVSYLRTLRVPGRNRGPTDDKEHRRSCMHAW